MAKNRRTIIIICIIALGILLEGIAYYLLFLSERDRTEISVIVYEDDKNWADLKEGAELAASNEENVEINFIIMPQGTTPEEQKAIILDEIETRAKYVVTTASDSYRLGELLNGVYASKIEFVLNGTDDKNYRIMAPDDYQMGYDLGQLLVQEEGNDISVGIVSLDDSKKSLNIRAQGVRVALGEANTHYEVWNNNIIGEDLKSFILNKLSNDEVDAIVILNEGALDTVTASINETESKVPVYAVVHSEKAVYYLDSKQLKYLAYTDEFGAGYAAVSDLLHPVKNKFVLGKNTPYSIVKRDDMYVGQNEKLLFPFVK